MIASKHYRFSFLALFTLCLIVALSSCSKKDVVSDEPAINPSGDTGAAAPSTGDAGAGNAGEAGNSDLATAYYAFDSFSLGQDARDVLKKNAEYMKANASVTVQIEGHCDERGTTEYNLALGERRSNAARDYMVKLGIDKSRLQVISYGEERPADPGHDESAWAKNRRASFVILSK